MTASVASDLAPRMERLRRMRKLDAVVDSARVAALAAVPRLRPELDAVLARRDPTRFATRRRRWGWRDVAAVVALLVALMAAGTILPSPRNGRPALPVDDAVQWASSCAVVALVVFAALESGRPRTWMLGAHTRTAWKLYVAFVVIWGLVVGYVIGSWRLLDFGDIPSPILWFVVLIASIVGMIVLVFVSRHRDGIARQDPKVAAKDEWGNAPGDADPLEEWWAAFASKLSPADRGAADRSYAATLDVLEREGIIRAADARRLRRKKPPVVWKGDAG